LFFYNEDSHSFEKKEGCNLAKDEFGEYWTRSLERKQAGGWLLFTSFAETEQYDKSKLIARERVG